MFDPQSVPGFLSAAEGELLCHLASRSPGPIVEIGSWCGRSTVWLGRGAQTADQRVIAIDTHRGSAEHQPGEAYHDPALTDTDGQVDTLHHLRRTLKEAGLRERVCILVSNSRDAAALMTEAVGMVFIDGSHKLADVLTDWRAWGPRIMPGGMLALHDVYPSPLAGGQAPAGVAAMIAASGLFDPLAREGSLYAWQRIRP